MKRAIYLVALICMLVMRVSWAEIPETISYQGVLTDAGGTAVADGDYSLTFSIYNVDTNGTALWTETHASVTVADGIFSVILGSVDPGVNPLDIPFDQQYWLGIAVNAGAELTPRIQLTSAAYSLNARSVADGAVTEDKIADDAIYATVGGAWAIPPVPTIPQWAGE